MAAETLETMPDAGAVARAAFLGAMRQVPAPVAIITTAEGELRRGLVATAWTSLSADPPMVLACVNVAASAHDMICRTRQFCINVLSAGDEELVAIFSNQRGLKGGERFDDAVWMRGTLGQPVLRDALASFECTLADGHDGRTHSILTGEVRSTRAQASGQGLLYCDGGFMIGMPRA